MKRRWLFLVIIGLSWDIPLEGGTIMLAWNASARATHYRVYYGVASGSYQVVVETGEATTASISGLTEETRYYFVATALNDAGESDDSNEVTAVTAPAPPQDSIPPVVVIISPISGSTVPRKAIVLIVIEAIDNVGVASVTATVKDHMANLLFQCPIDSSVPYSCFWPVPAANRKSYFLQAQAVDLAENVASSSVVEVMAQ